MFDQSAECFCRDHGAMKQMAAQMQRELESTRAEVRRGVPELSQEPTDNSTQLRRVIVEPMEALAGSNRIVAHQSLR